MCRGPRYFLDTHSCLFLFNGCHCRLNRQCATQHRQDTVTCLFPNGDFAFPSPTALSLERSLGPWVPLPSSTAMRTAEDARVLSLTDNEGHALHFSYPILCIHWIKVIKVPKLGFWITVPKPVYWIRQVQSFKVREDWRLGWDWFF